VKGRIIHALVDTQGLPLFVLDKLRNSFPNAHQVNAAVAKVLSLHIEIVKRSDNLDALARQGQGGNRFEA
jgi:hypothetical protein